MIVSLRIPIPELGAVEERYRSRPLESYPQDWKRYWYTTPRADWDRRCQEAP